MLEQCCLPFVESTDFLAQGRVGGHPETSLRVGERTGSREMDARPEGVGRRLETGNLVPHY